MGNSLRTVQMCMLDIAVEFKRICDKNNINYFLTGGTLLGAVRHQGFIPWDDDMDIGMLRGDYDKFLKVAKSELKSEFFLQTYQTDPYYSFGFAKIRIKGTSLQEDYTINSKQNGGIYLDIFPFDNMTPNKIKRKIQFLCFKITKWAAIGKSDYQFTEERKKRFSLAMRIICFPAKRKTLLKWEDFICRWYNKKKTQQVICFLGAQQDREHMPRSVFSNTIETSFEGIDFKIPKQYDRFLRLLYGNYMILPPKEKRGGQHAVNYGLGDYVPKVRIDEKDTDN